MKNKIAMLVMKQCDPDPRVSKQAEALSSAGYEVRVYCLYKKSLPEILTVNGVTYIRFQLIFPNIHSFTQWFKNIFPRKSIKPYINKKINSKENNSVNTNNTATNKVHSPISKINSQNIDVHYGSTNTFYTSPLRQFLKEWVWKPVFRNPVALKQSRKLHQYFIYYIFKFSLGTKLKLWKPNVIHAHDITTLPAAIINARELGSRVIYDAHEMEQHRNPPLNLFQRKWIRYIERKYGRSADKVITVSTPIADFLEIELKKKISLIYNSPEIGKNEPASDIRTDAGIDKDTPLLVYVGGIVINRGVEKLLEALLYIDYFHIALVGPAEKSVLNELVHYAKQIGVEHRVHILNPVAPNLVVKYIKTADIGVYAIRNVCRSYDYSMPNKLFEMTFAGLPIAVSNLTAVRAFLNEVKNGTTFDEDSAIDIANSVENIWNNIDDFILPAERLTAVFNKYGWPTQANKVVRIYGELLEY